MVVLNNMDRFQLAADAIRRVPRLKGNADTLLQTLSEKLVEHRQYIHEHGEDMPEVRLWRWNES
jgi:xylulose-5-phosphate/fructose-6-phosphate phosphoketolase